MKLKCLFESIEMGDEIIMVPVGNKADQVHGVLKLNESGQQILEMMANDTTEKEIVDILVKKYENDRLNLEDYVHSVIMTLRNNNLLDE